MSDVIIEFLKHRVRMNYGNEQVCHREQDNVVYINFMIVFLCVCVSFFSTIMSILWLYFQ